MENRTGIYGRLSLFAAALIWGASFIMMKSTLEDISPFYLLAVRFGAAAVILAVVFFKRLIKLDRRGVVMGVVMGTLLYAAYLIQTFGLSFTTPGKNAFLTSVYCIIVPFLYWLIARKRPDIYHVAASVICLAGIGLVSLDGNLRMGLGDLLTLVSGIFFALHIISVAKYSQMRDIFALTIIQFAAAAVLGLLTGLAFSEPVGIISSDSIISLIYLSVMATAVALLLQNVGQKYTHPSTAAIILSLEAVFGVLFSVVIYGERISLRVGCGFVFIFAAVVISETKLAFLKGKKRPDPDVNRGGDRL